MAKEPLKYWKADEVQAIADRLISRYHLHLEGEAIIYLFRSEHAESNGRIELGKALKVSGRNAYLAIRDQLEQINSVDDNPDEKEEAPPIKLIEIAFDVWKTLNVTQREALVDHELCHFGPDGMRGHDVEEFRAVIDRHGLWRPEIELMAATIAQQKLFPDGEADVERRVASDPKVRKAIDDIRPKKGSGIDKVTISTPGRKPVTLTAKD